MTVQLPTFAEHIQHFGHRDGGSLVKNETFLIFSKIKMFKVCIFKTLNLRKPNLSQVSFAKIQIFEKKKTSLEHFNS